jgi:DNA-binding MarR family transcriptional regulator
VHDTHDIDVLAGALLDLLAVLNSPRQDEVLLEAAGVTLDRALFPLLVRIGASGSIGVVELADQSGRDHSTISRQVAKLEALGLVVRQVAARDQRIREALITEAGRRMISAITEGRRSLLSQLLHEWSPEDRGALARLNRRLADAMKAARRL